MSQQAHQASTTSVWVVFLIFLRLLLAAFWRPLWSSAILGPLDFGLAAGAFAGLVWWRWAPWVVVLAGGVCGAFL